jgi:hypothetical protein
MRSNVSARAPTEVATYFLAVGSTVLKLKSKIKMMLDDIFFE